MSEKDILQALDIASNALRDIQRGTLYPRDIAQEAIKKMKAILEPYVDAHEDTTNG